MWGPIVRCIPGIQEGVGCGGSLSLGRWWLGVWFRLVGFWVGFLELVLVSSSIKRLSMEGTHSYYVISSGLDGLPGVTTWSY